MKTRAIMIILLVVSCLPVNLNGQWVQTNGPYGGTVTCFAEIPPTARNNVPHLFAGTYNGVFLSTDGGASWKAANNGVTNLPVNVLAAIDTNLFAGTAKGVFLSTDYGSSWTSVSTGLTSLSVKALATSPEFSGGTTLFAGTNTGGVFLTTNNGANWTRVNAGIPTNSTVNALGFIGTKLFAGTGTGVFLSTNNGNSWKALTPSSFNYYSKCLAIGQNQSGGMNIYAGTPSGVLLSADSGATWIGISKGLKDKDIKALAFAGTNLYAATYYEGVYVLTPDATNWTAVNNGLATTSVTSLFSSSTATSTSPLFAGTRGGVFLSSDRGGSWRPASNGLTNTQTWCFAVSGTGSGRTDLFAGCVDAGLFVSTDLGTSWKAINSGLGLSNTYVCSLSFGTQSGSTYFFAGTADGVYRSSDNGANWTAVNDQTRGWYLYALDATEKHVFASRDLSLYRSSDNGTTWTELITGWPRTRIIDFAVCRTEQGAMNIYAANSYQESDNGIFLSTDEGLTWAPVNNGLTNRSVCCMAASPNGRGGTNLFAGTYGGVFISTNYGTGWKTINPSLTDTVIYSLAAGVDNGGRSYLFAGTQAGGLYLSSNNGASWISVGVGLNGGSVNSLTVFSNDYSGGNAFAAIGYSGVWRRPLSEMITTAIASTSAEVPEEFALKQNYPNPFNPSTTILFGLTVTSFTTLKVYNPLGQEVAVLVNEVKNAGTHSVEWNAARLPSGVYLCRLQSSNCSETRKLLLLK